MGPFVVGSPRPDGDRGHENGRFTVATYVCLAAGLAAASMAGQLPDAARVLLGVLHGVVLVVRPSCVPVLLLLDVGLVGWQGAALAPSYFGTNMDTWMHLALIRRVAEHGIFPPDPYYRGHGAAPLTSVVHYVYGALASVTTIAGADLWRWGTAVAVLTIGASVYFCHLQVLRDSGAALLATVFYLWWRNFLWPCANYPRCVSPAFLFLAIGLLVRSLRSSHRAGSVAAGAALGLAIGSHSIAGVMGALVVATLLALEWRHAYVLESGILFARTIALPLLVGTLLTAAPWVMSNVAAMQAMTGMAPVVYRDDRLGQFVSQELQLPVLSWSLGLWAAPLLIGVAAVAWGRDRPTRIYVVGTALAAAAVLCPPFSGISVSLLGARYVARFVEVLPLPALIGLGLSRALRPADGDEPVLRVLGGVIVAAYVALLLPLQLPSGLRPLPRWVDRPELARLEPRLHGRVVLTDLHTAYVLPYYTGAFVTANAQGHSNPWLFDSGRYWGTLRALDGTLPDAAIRRFSDRYGVELALIPSSAPPAAAERLLASGEFRPVMREHGYVLLQRSRDDAG